MPTMFRPYEPDRLLPLAHDMQEWLPEGHFGAPRERPGG